MFFVIAACGSSPRTMPISTPEPTTADPAVATPTPTPARSDGPPATRREDVRDTYHGVVVEDPYRWLETPSPEVDRWIAAQTAYAETAIAASPDLATLREEFAAIYRVFATLWGPFMAGGPNLFAVQRPTGKEHGLIVLVPDPAKPETATVVYDPNAIQDAAIDWFVPSPDGEMVAIAVFTGGTEASDLHVVDKSGKELEIVPNVSRATASGSVAWTHDGKGFYYTRYPVKGEGHDDALNNWQEVWFHARGTPVTSDRRELGPELTKISQVRLFANARDRVLAVVQNGDSGPMRYFVRGPKGWRVVADWDDTIAMITMGARDDLWLVSKKNAPRGKVLHMPIDGTLAKATTVIAEGTDAVDPDFYEDRGVIDTGDRIYVPYQVGGPNEWRGFARTGGTGTRLPMPPLSETDMPVAWRGSLITGAATYTTPFTWYRVTKGKAERLDAISRKSIVDLSGFEVIRETATSKDGTKIPYTVIARKGAARDGSMRCYATGYGGFNISLVPNFVEWAGPLLSRDVCIAIANLRGGGEFGEEWHASGMLTKKQNVFDDFIAVVDDLVAKKITARDRVAIEGGSNGGLLIGAVIDQRPDIAKAAVIHVGVLDSLRYELSPNGATNTAEYGTVKDAAQFAALRAYSPVHNVKPHTHYPATFLLTGKNDGRVPPGFTYKMTAALQAAQLGDAPILLRVAGAAGHGAGTAVSERIEQGALVDAFVLAQLAKP
jgi:prolyl oligopeptidase